MKGTSGSQVRRATGSRLLAIAASWLAGMVIAPPARAQCPQDCTAGACPCPAGCAGPGMGGMLIPNVTSGPNGQIVVFSGTLNDDASGTCALSQVTTKLCCPLADGFAAGFNQDCPDQSMDTVQEGCCITTDSGKQFVPVTGDRPEGHVTCRVDVNPGVAQAFAAIRARGILEDTTTGTPGQGIDLITAFVVRPCNVQVDKEVSCDGGATLHD